MLPVIVRNLIEGTEYDIQVLAISIDDQQAIGEKIRALYPGFKSIRAISTGCNHFWFFLMRYKTFCFQAS